jgi:hypothetical protein
MAKKDSKPRDYSYLVGRDPLYVLNKKRSPDVVEYIVDEDDDWFIYVTTKRRKTGEITHVSMIIRKDMPNWLSYAQSQGWEATKMYEEKLNEE